LPLSSRFLAIRKKGAPAETLNKQKETSHSLALKHQAAHGVSFFSSRRFLGLSKMRTELDNGNRVAGFMDPEIKHALDQIELGEAELAVLKQEQVLRELLSTGLPTADATARLAALRKAVERLLAGSATQKEGRVERAA
jgi:hypothetical protein